VFAVVPQFFYLIHERIFKEVGKRGKLAESTLRTLMRIHRFLRKFGLNAGKIFFGKIHAPSAHGCATSSPRLPLRSVVARDFHAFGIDLLNAYGLTETSAAAFLNPRARL